MTGAGIPLSSSGHVKFSWARPCALDTGAFIIRIGFGAHSTISIIRNPAPQS